MAPNGRGRALASRSIVRREAGDQMIVPAPPSGVVTSRPAAAHAVMPPSRLDTANPFATRNSAAFCDRPPSLHHVLALRIQLVGSLLELGQRDEERIGGKTSSTLVVVSDVEEQRAVEEPLGGEERGELWDLR